MREKLFNIFWMVRAPLVGLLVIGMVVAVVLALRPSDQGTTVWAAKRDIGYGESITASDATATVVPDAAIVEGALDFGDFADDDQQLLAARAIPRGTVLSESDLLGSPNSRTLQAGYSIIQLPLTSTAAMGVQSGDVLDIWGQLADCAELTCPLEVISQSAQVIELREISSSFTTDQDVLLIVSVDQASIGDVLGAANSGSINLVVKSPAH